MEWEMQYKKVSQELKSIPSV